MVPRIWEGEGPGGASQEQLTVLHTLCIETNAMSAFFGSRCLLARRARHDPGSRSCLARDVRCCTARSTWSLLAADLLGTFFYGHHYHCGYWTVLTLSKLFLLFFELSGDSRVAVLPVDGPRLLRCGSRRVGPRGGGWSGFRIRSSDRCLPRELLRLGDSTASD